MATVSVLSELMAKASDPPAKHEAAAIDVARDAVFLLGHEPDCGGLDSAGAQ